MLPPGFGVVRDTRSIDLREGMNSVGFTDVAQFIDPTSVTLTDVSRGEVAEGADEERPGLQVVEQNFEFDLVSPQKLLEEVLDRRVHARVAQVKGDPENGSDQFIKPSPTSRNGPSAWIRASVAG